MQIIDGKKISQEIKDEVKEEVAQLKAEGKESDAVKSRETVHYEKVKVVKFILKPDRKKMSQRMCLLEHPFGTIKRALGAPIFC